jgi:hypothetical protein
MLHLFLLRVARAHLLAAAAPDPHPVRFYACCLFGCLVVWLFGCLVVWLVGWLFVCLVVWLVGWLFVCLCVSLRLLLANHSVDGAAYAASVVVAR